MHYHKDYTLLLIKKQGECDDGVRFIFCKDEFIMHGKIWMSQICHAHNCRAVQKMKRTRSCGTVVQLDEPCYTFFQRIKEGTSWSSETTGPTDGKNWDNGFTTGRCEASLFKLYSSYGCGMSCFALNIFSSFQGLKSPLLGRSEVLRWSSGYFVLSSTLTMGTVGSSGSKCDEE